MKAYAEYFNEDGILFRRNTLLQFGDSWELIGNVVLANPGSADPIEGTSREVVEKISDFYEKYRNNEDFISSNWFEFSPDSTMGFVEKIFNGWYLGKNIELNGVIQLFNTFNLKNQNLSEAITQIGKDSELLFTYNVYKYFNEKPTYFGFGNEVLDNEILRRVAMHIFNESSEAVRGLYRNSFSENSFYHPMYVNRAYKQKHFQGYKNSILSGIVKNA